MKGVLLRESKVAMTLGRHTVGRVAVPSVEVIANSTASIPTEVPEFSGTSVTVIESQPLPMVSDALASTHVVVVAVTVAPWVEVVDEQPLPTSVMWKGADVEVVDVTHAVTLMPY